MWSKSVKFYSNQSKYVLSFNQSRDHQPTDEDHHNCLMLCLGVAIGEGSFADGDGGSLRTVNMFMRDYRELHDEVDAWLVLKVRLKEF